MGLPLASVPQGKGKLIPIQNRLNVGLMSVTNETAALVDFQSFPHQEYII